MRKILFFIFLLTISSVYALVINEIMYNPSTDQGKDSKLEWIELYNNESYEVNLSNYNLDDKELSGMINSSQYIVLVRNLEGFESYYGNNDSVWNESDDSYNILEISFSLTNTGDVVNLSNGKEEIVNYNGDWGADGNGYSLEKINYEYENDEGNWAESLIINGTPGKVNSKYNYSYDIEYDIIINEFLPNPIGDDDANMPDGEWVELYNIGGGVDLLGFYLKDNSNKEVLITDVNTGGTYIDADGYLVVYITKYGFLNNDGLEIIKLYDLNDNKLDEVSYSDSEEGVAWAKKDDTWLKISPTPGEENVEEDEDSGVHIDKIYDLGSNDKAEWGSNIRIKLEIYKGNTNKNLVKAWIENDEERISKETRTNVYEKYKNYTITLPLQINPNCNENFKDGKYNIKVSGLDEEDSEPLKVAGFSPGFCKVKTSRKLNNIVYEVNGEDEFDIGDVIETEVNIINNKDEDINFEVWSYIYRGPKSYSGDREDNLKKVNVDAGDSKNIILKNNFYGESGDYKLKVKIKKEDVKTAKEFTRDIEIKNIEDESKQEVLLHSEDQPIIENVLNKDFITGKVVYESTNIKAERLALYFFSGLLVFILIIMHYERR